ncbi:STAS domain-containing protein [Hufsiella ginkgonis]|uniref:STAS domain-containing protein n=1 Tax=Hufsiella ginkgonis TaxID=2695274 RepID=A0A7K1XZB7_9SPHI|nr:STAS domain-containing protein [Hufsiella ginkgonis]MXV16303.1 STAS domain-containing protein [Hufsiella ginkgonis]
MIQVKELGDYVVASLKLKEANLTEAERFKKELMEVIDQGHKKIIVDFEQVMYVDSSFLGALVSSLKYAMTLGSDIAVVHLNKDIFNLFQLIRMDKVFHIYKTLP